MVALTRLWAFDQLSARPNGIGRPPWDELGVDDYLPAATSAGGENATEPLAEQTMGPLLIWAMRMVDDLSGDILAAWAERQRLTEMARTNTATPAGHAALEAYLGPLIAAQAPLPATTNHGKTVPRPLLHRRHHRRITRPGRPCRQPRGTAGRSSAASRAVPAGHPGDRPDRREAVADGARLQRGPSPDAAPGHGRVHRLRLPDRHAPRRGPGPAHRMLPRSRSRSRRAGPDGT